MVLTYAHTSTIVFRIELGEKIPDSILNVVKKYGISSGIVIGIGGLKSVKLGIFKGEGYDVKEYKCENGALELVSLIGNIALLNDEPSLHLHVTIGLPNGQTVSGHLFEAEVYPTVEIFILKLEGLEPLRRSYNPKVKLKLLQA